jgi:hypothetical protein
MTETQQLRESINAMQNRIRYLEAVLRRGCISDSERASYTEECAGLLKQKAETLKQLNEAKRNKEAGAFRSEMGAARALSNAASTGPTPAERIAQKEQRQRERNAKFLNSLGPLTRKISE